jgi:hypothetical protein
MSMQGTAGGGVSRTNPGGGALSEVLDRILDKGIVIDAWASVSLLGIEILSIQARVVVASVETYLKYAQELNSITAPEARQAEIEEPKMARFEAVAEEPSSSRAPEYLPEEEVIKYLGEHTGGLRVDQLAEHFHAPKEVVEATLSHLVEEHKIRRANVT